MPIYKITETRPATQVWEFKVEANSEEEAIEKVLEGTLDPINYYMESNDFEESEYDIEEAEEN